MFIGANVLVIVIIGLIAYWWANQGLFSALLHLLCVIVAGAVAFAFWEPLTVGLLLRGSGFDDYAWGLVLVVVFAITLFVLRIAMDRLVPANVRVPRWADLTFGGICGAASGVLTVGILLIGAGHIQSGQKLLGGIRGWARDANRSAQIARLDQVWIPAHQLTSEFYSLLSVTSLRSGRPMRQYSPEIYKQTTLLRDSYGGRGKLSLQPSAASVERLYFAQVDGTDRYYVQVRFGLAANDFGEQLTLSSAQVRLVEAATGMAKPRTVHPSAWKQYSGYHLFDDRSHYVSSEPGKESSDPTFEFAVPAGFVPRFIQIRGTRFELPPEALPAPARLMAQAAGSRTEVIPVTGAEIQSAVSISNTIRPITISKNMLPSSIKEVNNLLTTGQATFKRGRSTGSSALRIDGIFEPTGTRLVRVDVSRGGPADIFQFRDQVPDDATIALVDTLGNEYSPVGYFYQQPDGVTIRLEPTRRLRSIDDVPSLPSSGTNKLDMLFYVTEGATITGLRFGDIDVGHCDVTVPKEE